MPVERILSFPAQTCHGAAAFFPSPFERALVLTLDDAGGTWSACAAIGEGSRLRPAALALPPALGRIHARVTTMLGFRPHAEDSRTQWLSTRGRPSFLPALRSLLDETTDELDEALGDRLGVTGGEAEDPERRAALARSLQDFIEETVVESAQRVRRATGLQQLCVAGGVFRNTLLVRALEESAGFDSVFVQPATGNAGTAVGASYLAWAALDRGIRSPRPHGVSLGPAFGEVEIKAVLDNCKIVYQYHPAERGLLGETAKLLHAGKMVAWYQGRTEFGPRALGHRSLLASPFAPYVAENLNHYVKHRDRYHPFTLSVPAEESSRYFDCTDNCRQMTSLGRLRPGHSMLEPFAFADRRIRVHVVHRDDNPRFWQLLHRFGESSPAPILVNTSFSLFGEPLVCTPRDAVRTLYCSGLDALAIEQFLVVK
jgi:carbamoyltransferase